MLRYCRLLLLLLLALPARADDTKDAFQAADRRDWGHALICARRSDNDILLKLITWQYLSDADSGANFDETTRFITENPDWPGQKKLRVRAEQSLKQGSTNDQEVLAWFAKWPPLTGIGKLMLAEAYERNGQSNDETITGLLRGAWKDGDFEEPQEKQLLDTHGKKLRQEDHIARIDRLLWEEKISPAKRILGRVPGAERKLFEARMALIDNKKNAGKLVEQVPEALKNNPGLIYDRMRYRARRDDDKGVRQMLLMAPASVPYPEKWWKTREMQVREALDEGNVSMARKLINNHGQLENNERADALWLAGWIKCEFEKRPKEAYQEFSEMFNRVRYAVSKARAAYWAGRAAEKADDKSSAEHWYTTASAYPATFYGQLASLKVNGHAPLRIPAAPDISASDRSAFENSDIARAAKMAIELDDPDLATLLINYLAENAPTDGQAALAAGIGKDSGQPFLSVRGAKKAMQRNIVLIDSGYPTPLPGVDFPIERALMLAISRQESEFDAGAKSPSHAMGLMQLLPSTAKEIARKNDMRFSSDKLYEPEFNTRVGSIYLSRLIDAYDGSYIMAIAAYNAGPGNVRKWLNSFGSPGKEVDSAVNWIEKIPFSETRNYVQRVTENLQVYRHIESGGDAPTLKIGDDLVR